MKIEDSFHIFREKSELTCQKTNIYKYQANVFIQGKYTITTYLIAFVLLFGK